MGFFGRKKDKKKEAEPVQKQKVTVDELVKMYLPDIQCTEESEIGEEIIYDAIENAIKNIRKYIGEDTNVENGNLVIARYIIDETKQLYASEENDFKELKNLYADIVRKAVNSTKSMAEYPDELILWAENDMTPSEVKAYKCTDADIAIRTMAIGAMFDDPEDVLKFVICSAIPTHGSPEGIKCAAVAAMCVYLACHKVSKKMIVEYAMKHYPGTDPDTLPANITVNNLVVENMAIDSKQALVVIPEAIACFAESSGPKSALENVKSFSSDSVNVAGIAAGFSAAMYGDRD